MTLTVILIFLVLFLLLGSGTWVGISLGVLGMGGLYLGFGGGSLRALANIGFNSLNSFTMVAIPLYILMAALLASGGATEHIYSTARHLLARVPGGLLHANIGGCAIFASVCGSTAATIAAIGTIALPAFENRKYDRRLVLGTLTASGTLGLLIPPSLTMIIYGAMCSVSVGKLFIGGIIPGIIVVCLFMSYVAVRCSINKQLAVEDYKPSLKEIIRAVISLWPVIITIVTVLGSIYLGICTPSEAGAIGICLALLTAIIYRKLSWNNIKSAINTTVTLTSMMFLIFIGGMILQACLANFGLPEYFSTKISEMGLSPLQLIMALSIAYLILGCVVESLGLLVTTLPFVFPMVMAVGLDPIWFGVIVVLYDELAVITPPVGINLFIMQGMSKAPMAEIVKGVWPFVVLLFLAVILFTLFPGIVTFLPNRIL